CPDPRRAADEPRGGPVAEGGAGAGALGLPLPLTLQWGRESGVDLKATLATVTSRAAAILGVRAGTLADGAPADICLFDERAPWIVRPEALASQGKNTPFQGLEMTGRVGRTIVGGRTVHGA